MQLLTRIKISIAYEQLYALHAVTTCSNRRLYNLISECAQGVRMHPLKPRRVIAALTEPSAPRQA